MKNHGVNWNGAFAFKKSIGSVKFVPISQMTVRDWRWLEFENIRTIAQNRIAQSLIAGNLRGFFQVMITEKAAKQEYFWPATEEMVRDFSSSQDPQFFLNEPENFTESKALESLERLRGGMIFLPIWATLGILEILTTITESVENETELSRIQETFLEEMKDEDVQLLMATLMMWEMSLEEAESLLDDMPESDEADEVRDWINDQVAELSQGRQSMRIAAGRGLR